MPDPNDFNADGTLKQAAIFRRYEGTRPGAEWSWCPVRGWFVKPVQDSLQG